MKCLKPENLKKLEGLAKPLIKFLNDKYDPHTKIIIDTSSAEIVNGLMAIRTDEFIKD